MTLKTLLSPSEAAQTMPGLPVHLDTLRVSQAVIAAAVLEPQLIVQAPGRIASLTLLCGVCGTVGQTTLVVNVNGAPVGGEAVRLNTDPDGSFVTVAIGVDVAVGDIVSMEVTAAPTGGTLLSGAVQIDRLFSVNP